VARRLSDLPPHLRTEVSWWCSYFEARGQDPTAVEYPDSEYFIFDILSTKLLSTRLSCINAINEWYSRILKRPGPFTKNPWSYPLLTRFLPVTFAEAYQHVTSLPDPDRGYLALILVCRFSVKDICAWGGFVRPNLVEHGDVHVPVTDTVAGWLTPWVPPPNPKVVRSSLAKVPWSVTDLHGALFAELAQRQIPEVTRASLYGRWSAMKFESAVKRVGFFRSPLPGTGSK
jgi:hypothetical protein